MGHQCREGTLEEVEATTEEESVLVGLPEVVGVIMD
jgi:hypothetical protein